ncbi:MAG: heme ABC exporter ATP-binding protein CcmA [Gemmatimonadetes bacterium]|nr:heme ABC exporter ATP-binding protein CcmA [Gemmatimonadota bacterium]NNK61804.1 heme ABC exporter ATP-binding protein CcmA [Gemmatimonadota bacterium]
MTATAPGPRLEAEGLARAFGAHRAVDHVSFTLEPGEVVALLGPNGAGKTTLLRLLSGALRPSEGVVKLDGRALDTRGPEWQSRVGVLSHQGFLYGHLSARENLRFYADLYALDHARERVERGLESVQLTPRADDTVRTYSRGMRQRLALARTLLHDPDVVLLDEPYTGLDAHAAAVLRGVLEALRDGARTVLLVTHNLTEGLALSDRIAIQVRGRWVHEAPARDFDPTTIHERYRQTVEGAGGGAP